MDGTSSFQGTTENGEKPATIRQQRQKKLETGKVTAENRERRGDRTDQMSQEGGKAILPSGAKPGAQAAH